MMRAAPPALGLTLALLACTAQAAPVRYALEPEGSVVGFQTDFGPDRIEGQFPVSRADVVLDLAALSHSAVVVTMDVGRATASFPFAAEAMRGPKVLDAASFPEMAFRSTAIRAEGEGARIEGLLTIRGVTRPVTLTARLYRQAGHEEGDHSHMTVLLSGHVLRSDFGATGWSDMVGDEVRLNIRARIKVAG